MAAKALTGAAVCLEELGREPALRLWFSLTAGPVWAETHLSHSQVPGGCSSVILMLGTEGSQFVFMLKALQPG